MTNTSTLGPYQVHPLADAFPLIEGDEFNQLVMDVKRNGLREPIVLTYDQKVLIDGRNRWRACEAAGVDVVHRTLGAHYTEQMILDLIVSANIERRHLNPGQLAFLALEVEKRYAELAKARQAEAVTNGNRTRHGLESPVPVDLPEPSERRHRESREQAAKAVGTSASAVQHAKAVERDAPDLATRVRAGGLALDSAYKQSRARVAEQRKHEPEPEKPKPHRAGQVTLTLRTHTGDPVSYPKPASKPTFNETPGEGISWAAWSWNPVTGCLHGCRYCYARDIATSDRFKASYPVGFTPLFHHERLDAPANTTIPAAHRDDPAYCRVFVCSMADLYGRWVPDEWIQRVHEAMLAEPRWQYITLTKFPARYVGLDLPAGAWVGTSVDEQKRVRIAEDAFRQVDHVKVKWLSLEPLLEPLQFTDLSMFDWVVIGAQTETRQPDGPVPAFAPPFEWVARIVSQAREAGCRVHLKPNLLGQVSGRAPGMALPNEYPEAVSTAELP